MALDAFAPIAQAGARRSRRQELRSSLDRLRSLLPSVRQPWADTEPMARTPMVGYRLTEWPALPGVERTAMLLRALSVMSQRHVTAVWFSRQVACTPDQARAFLDTLVQQGVAQRVTGP